MKFGVLKFGEQCPRHPAPKPRGVDTSGAFAGPPKAESEAIAKNRRSGDWATWDKARPASAATVGAAAPPTATPRVKQPASSLALTSSSQAVPSFDLAVGPDRRPAPRPASAETEKAVVRGTTPVYMQERPQSSVPAAAAAAAGRQGGLAGARSAGSSAIPDPQAPVDGTSGGSYDVEKTVDSFIAKVAQKAQERANFNPSQAVQARALATLLRSFGQGDGVTRGYLEVNLSFMGTSLRPRALDALWSRLNPNDETTVSFKQASQIIVGLEVPPRARPEVRVHLETILEKLQKRFPPGRGMQELRRAFAVIDKDKSGALSPGELAQYLKILGLQLTAYDVDVMIAAFDRDGNGSVSLGEFCRAVRGPMSSTRADLIKLAFRQLDLDGSETLTLDELTDRYDSSKHPEVMAGRRTEEDVVREFIEPWDARLGSEADGIVTLAEFLDYYDDISATIENDDYFELMIRNCWHISGGSGVAQNTANKRVLVTFTDHTQKVVEIKNDLGLKLNDMHAVKRRLEQQGVKNILTIKLSG